MHNNIDDYFVLKFFGINTHFEKSSSSIKVLWSFPLVGLAKINTEDICHDHLGLIAYDNILGGSHGEYIGNFSSFIDVKIALYVEIRRGYCNY